MNINLQCLDPLRIQNYAAPIMPYVVPPTAVPSGTVIMPSVLPPENQCAYPAHSQAQCNTGNYCRFEPCVGSTMACPYRGMCFCRGCPRRIQNSAAPIMPYMLPQTAVPSWTDITPYMPPPTAVPSSQCMFSANNQGQCRYVGCRYEPGMCICRDCPP